MTRDERRFLYPTVTEIIGKQMIEKMASIPPERLINAAERGTAIHRYCGAYARNLPIHGMQDEYAHYYLAFVRWYDANVTKLVRGDERLYDDGLEFSGEYDMIVQLNDGSRALIDIKTSYAPSDTWQIQLAAYDHLCQVSCYEYDRIFVLHLKKREGKAEAIEIPQRNIVGSWNVFKSALECYNYFHRR